MQTIEQALEERGDGWIADVIASQNQKRLRASGRSAASLRKTVTSSGQIHMLKLLGAAYLYYSQNGRGPNRSGKPSRAQVEGLKLWVKQKGLDIPAYAIAVKQAREGTLVPNQHNPGGVLSEPLDPKRVRGLLKTAVRPILIQKAKSTFFK